MIGVGQYGGAMGRPHLRGARLGKGNVQHGMQLGFLVG